MSEIWQKQSVLFKNKTLTDNKKPFLIFSQYVWLVNTLRRYDRMTLEELNDKWIRDEVADGNPLSRSTFNRGPILICILN